MGKNAASLWTSVGFSPLAAQLFQRRMEPLHALSETWIFSDHLAAALEAVNDGGVITAAKGGSNFHELHSEQLSHEIHRDLARYRESFRSRLGSQTFGGDAPFTSDSVLNRLR